jgi:hypothetical protein
MALAAQVKGVVKLPDEGERSDRLERVVRGLLAGHRLRVRPSDAPDRPAIMAAVWLSMAHERYIRMSPEFRRRLAARVGGGGQPRSTRREALIAGASGLVGLVAGLAGMGVAEVTGRRQPGAARPRPGAAAGPLGGRGRAGRPARGAGNQGDGRRRQRVPLSPRRPGLGSLVDLLGPTLRIGLEVGGRPARLPVPPADVYARRTIDAGRPSTAGAEQGPRACRERSSPDPGNLSGSALSNPPTQPSPPGGGRARARDFQ